MAQSFDDFDDNGANEVKAQKPFFTVNQENDSELLKWLKEDFDSKKHASTGRINTYRKYLALFKGIHFKNASSRNDINEDRSSKNSSIRNPRIVVNFIQEMCETKVSEMAQNKPAITATPANNEYKDELNTEAIEKMIKTRWYEVDVDKLLSKADKTAFIGGTAWVFSLWDKALGKVHPQYKSGMSVVNPDGEEIKLENEVFVGDVGYKVLGPDKVFPQVGIDDYDNLEHVTWIEHKHLEEIKKDYPNANVKESDELVYDYTESVEKKSKHFVTIKHFYHKKTKHSPAVYIKFTDGAILEKQEGYKHGRLPCRPITDVDVPGELHGRSFIDNIRRLQNFFNSNESAIARNFALVGAPKWIAPKGACSISSYNNETVVMEYKGPVAPRLESMSTTGAEVFNHQQTIESRIRKLSLVQGVARGDIPPGVTAAVALQYLSEEEKKRLSTYTGKRNKLIVDLAKDTAELMKEFYRNEDERLSKILGDDSQYLIDEFNVSAFESSCDFRLENSSSLADTKSGKISAIVELNASSNTAEEGPIFTREKVYSLLDLANKEEFMNAATVAIKAAKSENAAMLRGLEIEEPKEWEDHINHYLEHIKCLQERRFKEKVPGPAQEQLKTHIMTTEMLMFQRAQKNPMFAQKLSQIEYYPIFFTLPPMPPQMPPQQGV